MEIETFRHELRQLCQWYARSTKRLTKKVEDIHTTVDKIAKIQNHYFEHPDDYPGPGFNFSVVRTSSPGKGVMLTLSPKVTARYKCLYLELARQATEIDPDTGCASFDHERALRFRLDGHDAAIIAGYISGIIPNNADDCLHVFHNSSLNPDGIGRARLSLRWMDLPVDKTNNHPCGPRRLVVEISRWADGVPQAYHCGIGLDIADTLELRLLCEHWLAIRHQWSGLRMQHAPPEILPVSAG